MIGGAADGPRLRRRQLGLAGASQLLVERSAPRLASRRSDEVEVEEFAQKLKEAQERAKQAQ